MTLSLPAIPNSGNAEDRKAWRMVIEALRALDKRSESASAGIRQQIIKGSSGGSSADLSNAAPKPLAATPQPGILGQAPRADHQHPFPSASEVGADPAGTAAAAVSAHVGQPNPHSQYALASEILGVPYSRSHIPAEETATIPAGHNILIVYPGLDLEGDLVLDGDLVEID